jgi:hypothetical protein
MYRCNQFHDVSTCRHNVYKWFADCSSIVKPATPQSIGLAASTKHESLAKQSMTSARCADYTSAECVPYVVSAPLEGFATVTIRLEVKHVGSKWRRYFEAEAEAVDIDLEAIMFEMKLVAPTAVHPPRLLAHSPLRLVPHVWDKDCVPFHECEDALPVHKREVCCVCGVRQ